MFFSSRIRFGRQCSATFATIILGLISWLGGGRAGAEEASAASLPVVKRLADLHVLSAEERAVWRPMRAEVLVYYYDPAWRIFWGHNGDTDEYLGLDAGELDLKTGQRVRLEGRVQCASGLSLDIERVTVLEEKAPLVALDTHGRVGDTSYYSRRFVAVEGYVDRQTVTDSAHLQLDFLAEGRSLVVRVLRPEGAAPPAWEGARLRVQGVYAVTSDPTGAAPTIELWCPGPDRVEVLGSLATDARFEQPVTPIEQLATAAPGTLVHLAGTARMQRPGQSVLIRDGSGQLTLQTAQTKTVATGQAVEAIGVVPPKGFDGTLREGLFRESQRTETTPAGEERQIRLADELRAMLPEEAARAHAVRLSGVALWARAGADFFFLSDASGGVQVYRSPDDRTPLFMGSRVEVVGVTAPGRFTPVVRATSIVSSATIELPVPRPVTLEQALTGVEEAQWVGMSGYLREVETEGPWVKLRLTTPAGAFSAMLAPNDRWAKLVGSVVRVSGVCSAETNDKRQLTGIRVWVPSSRLVEVEEPLPDDPYAVPARSIASLRQYSPLDLLNRRVRVSGVVVRQVPGRVVQVQEGNDALLILSQETVALQPGDRVEAVGFAGRQNNRLVLREAVFRRTGSEPQPVAQRLTSLAAIDPELDGRLVSVTGTILRAGAHDKGMELVLQCGDVVFGASLGQHSAELPATWTPQTQVTVTGVAEVRLDEYGQPRALEVLLRSLADVRVLRPAPWWTAARALAATGLLAAGLLLGLGWVMLLRRRVRQQTELIRTQIENEKAARLDAALARASRLESLGVLAGGIAHDFNNLLTVVVGNLSIAKLDAKGQPELLRCLSESERAALRARSLTQQLLTFAKGGEPIRAATALPELVREATQFALHGTKVRCDFAIAADLWPADVDRGQISQVVNNLVLNAAQAMPAGGEVRLELRNEEIGVPRAGLAVGRYVRVSLVDRGVGISAENLTRIFDPYFTTKEKGSGLGLATVHSIVKRHRGHIEVRSQPGAGTTFEFWLPAASVAPEVTSPAVEQPPAKPGRVLFMDDEESIRLIGAKVLRRHGLEVTAVADGTAVVREYEQARADARPFDLVVLDLTVPGGMGGAEAIERLRAIDPQVRAIVASGYSNDPVVANYREHGFAGRVPKPYQATDLLEAVEAVLRAG